MYAKSSSSEAIRGMKLKLCRNVHNISLYKNYVFYCRCSCAFIAMATYNFHRLIMGKVKVGLYFYLTADILTKVFQKCSLSSPLPNIWVLSKPLIWLVAMATERINLWKKIKKSEAIRGMKLKLCRNVHISLYKIYLCFLLPLLKCFHCYGNLVSIDL